jgi:hypothetical protein
MFGGEAVRHGQPVGQCPGEAFEAVLGCPSGTERGVIGQPYLPLAQVVQTAGSEPDRAVGRAGAGYHGAGAGVARDVEHDAQLPVQLREPPGEELPGGLDHQVIHGNLPVAARPGSTAVYQYPHREGDAPGPVADLAGAAEQGELVEVMVENSPELS